jgi:hypothetical protein
MATIFLEKGQNLVVKIEGSPEACFTVTVDESGICLVEGPPNHTHKKFTFSHRGWCGVGRSVLERPSRTQQPGMVRVYDRFEEMSESDVTDEMCRPSSNAGARFCKDCKQSIYMRSALSEDAYGISDDGFYRHAVCPTLFDYPQPPPMPEAAQDFLQ